MSRLLVFAKNSNRSLLARLLCLGVLLLAWHTGPASAATVRYAKDGGLTSGSCDSWANACTLQAALGAAASGDEIWVAAGTHKPHASDRTVSFILKPGVAVYGGFAGTETALGQRDFVANPTILSGDLNGDDNANIDPSEPTRAENAYHVVFSATNSAVVLDGFSISGGNANGTSSFHNRGGGMYNNFPSPTLTNLTFSANSATNGGGMHNDGSSPTLSNVIFSDNTAASFGGGMNNDFGSSPMLTGVTFSSNSASSGGGMSNRVNNISSNPTLMDVTFSGNSATSSGGGMHNERGNPMLTDVTFSGNSATYGGGMYNLESSPTLENVTFSHNSAFTGGGMINIESGPELANVTFSGNSATSAGDGMNNITNSVPKLTNVIIADSGNGRDCMRDNSSVIHSASSHNLIEASGTHACGLTDGVDGNIIGSDPKLGPLVDNGGATQTHALLSGSPAVDAGTNSGCPASDQRGMTRPVGASCDMGAFELYTGVYHVKTIATGNMDCQSWDDACTLQFALKAAAAGDELWVAAGTYTPQASNLLASCQEIRAANPIAADGDYAINANGNVFTVYCHDMAGAPREYLTLFYTGTDQNFSQYTAGGASPGTDVRTRYDKIRLDPVNLKVDISDQTFAQSTGQLNHGGAVQVTSMSYAIAMDCVDWNSQLGLANIDLRGTPFTVTDTFEGNGFQHAGSATKSANDQVVDITGGGYCGWWAPVPAPSPAYNQLPPSFTLELGYIGTGREVSFHLRSGVALYGGFAGTETLRSQRDIAANPTILSGDLAGNDNANIDPSEPTRFENAYHVVVGSGTDATAVLDGFTISGGNANGASSPHNRGGGMHNWSSSPTLANVTFSGNSASGGGGGMRNEASSPTLENVTFSGNSALGGGGMNNDGSSPTLTDVTFSGNSAFGDGGGMYDFDSSPELSNVTFSGNVAINRGGGMLNYESNPPLTNVTFSDNSANTEGGGMFNTIDSSPMLTNVIIANSSSGGDCVNDGTSTLGAASSHNQIEDGANACGLADGVDGNIIGQDPMLGPLADNGGATQTHALLSGSPAIDAGTNSNCPASDQRGVARPQGPACDIGAYEIVAIEAQNQLFLPLIQR